MFKRVGLNMIAFAYAQAVSVMIQFVQVPIFLIFWKKNVYGEWLVVTGLTSFLTLMDFGVTRASESRGIALAASEDLAAARVVVHTSQVFTLMAIGVLGLLSATVGFVDLTSLLSLNEINVHDCRMILWCMLGVVGISLQMGVIDARFKISQRTPLGSFLLANRRVVTFAVITTSLALGLRPVEVALCWVIGDLVFGIIIEILCRRISLRLHGFKESSWKEFKLVLGPSISYLSFPLSQALTVQGGVQLLNQFAGPAQVVTFAMTRTLVRVLLQGGMVLNYSLKPEVSRLAGLGKADEIDKFRKKAWILSVSMGVFGLTFLLLTGPTIIEVWSHGKVEVGRWVILLVGLHAALNVTWMIPGAVDMGLNRHGYIAKVILVSSAISLICWMALRTHLDPIIGASLLLAIPEAAAVIGLVRSQNRKSSQTT